MATILQAAKWMLEGKRVRRPDDGDFVYAKDHADCLTEYGCDSCIIAIEDLLADDWQLADPAPPAGGSDGVD